MWDYTDKVMDHFRNPRNVGYIKDPDGEGEVGSMACGDVMRLMFKLDDQGRIADAKFQTFGCGSAIASASVLTELIKGKTLDEVEKITNQEIVDYLGGLPEQKMHCSVMGREALEAAIENYRTGEVSTRKLEGRVVCVCFGVTEKSIRNAIEENGLTTVEQVTNYTKAGGGCGGCKEEIGEIIAEILGREPEAGHEEKTAEPAAPKKLTTLQKVRLVEEVIEKEIRPEMAKHGGDLELVDIDGNNVVVKLQGACAKCEMTWFTLKGLIESKLREKVSEELVAVEEK
ncbi:MAG: Fe-S cluster assembly protein NifU [Candidatus Glassbacteria bacterium]|nr:Fe-S cluster assembly protein NifU [Candidatus Glassbacteria bacterium]